MALPNFFYPFLPMGFFWVKNSQKWRSHDPPSLTQLLSKQLGSQKKAHALLHECYDIILRYCLVLQFSLSCTLMQPEVAEQDSGPDPGDESSQTSFPENDELSDGSFGDCISTISLAGGVEMRDDEDDESPHVSSKSGGEMQLGIEASGLGLQEDSPDGLLCGEDYTCPR